MHYAVTHKQGAENCSGNGALKINHRQNCIFDFSRHGNSFGERLIKANVLGKRVQLNAHHRKYGSSANRVHASADLIDH
jgi:hypothetical protein